MRFALKKRKFVDMAHTGFESREVKKKVLELFGFELILRKKSVEHIEKPNFAIVMTESHDLCQEDFVKTNQTCAYGPPGYGKTSAMKGALESVFGLPEYWETPLMHPGKNAEYVAVIDAKETYEEMLRRLASENVISQHLADRLITEDAVLYSPADIKKFESYVRRRMCERRASGETGRRVS